jgi:hypothetical protein
VRPLAPLVASGSRVVVVVVAGKKKKNGRNPELEAWVILHQWLQWSLSKSVRLC